MARVIYSRWKQIVVHNLVEMNPEEFFLSVVREAVQHDSRLEPEVFWRNGISWVRNFPPDNDVVIEDYLRGRVHLANVYFARVGEYRPSWQVEFKPQHGPADSFMVRLCDNPSDEVLSMGRFLKNYCRGRSSAKKEEDLEAVPPAVQLAR